MGKRVQRERIIGKEDKLEGGSRWEQREGVELKRGLGKKGKSDGKG